MTFSREQQRTSLHDYKNELNARLLQRCIRQGFEHIIWSSHGLRLVQENPKCKLHDQLRNCRHSRIDNDCFCAWSSTDSTRIGISHTYILYHFEESGKISKLSVWVSHKLNDLDRRGRRSSWLGEQIIYCRWKLALFFSNEKRKRRWSGNGVTAGPQTNPELPKMKLIILFLVGCKWCVSLGDSRMQSVHQRSNFLSTTTTCCSHSCTKNGQNWLMSFCFIITPGLCCIAHSWTFSRVVIGGSRSSVLIASKLYSLFWAMQYVLNGKTFATPKPKTEVGEFHDSKLIKFENNGIHDLACCRKNVIEINGD